MSNTGTLKAWISAFRLRTLPLALASIGMGSFLAAADHQFKLGVVAWCMLTTLLLQILSNLANDYGDTKHGADSEHRQGPKRAVQAGLISPGQMKRAMLIFTLLSLFSGLMLLWTAFGTEGFYLFSPQKLFKQMEARLFQNSIYNFGAERGHFRRKELY